MHEKEFNLLRNPWILVMKPNGATEEVSLLELFRRAPEWRGLAGETPAQDVAVLRMLLAVLHTVFSRHDPDGRQTPLSSPIAALQRWKAIWDRAELPWEIIRGYLLRFRNRFWLFHPEYPFYQVPDINDATEYTAAKLNGELSQGENKANLFLRRAGSEKDKLSYSEAARWLLYINAFDDASAKPSIRKAGLPSPGVGRLGKLGLVTVLGGNLFQTLMLNLVFLQDGEDKLWAQESPVWERSVKADERTEITVPDNPSALLTLQSRRLLLKRENGSVTGLSMLGGDFFPEENAFAEQMTTWKNVAKKQGSQPEFLPKRHDPTRYLWRDFPALMSRNSGSRPPGVIAWLARLKEEGCVSSKQFCFQVAAVEYGSKNCSVANVFSDSIFVNAGLLTALDEGWVSRIANELDVTEKLVLAVGQLARNIAMASGNADGKAKKETAMEMAYFRLDMPFRKWLAEIDPENDEMQTACELWWEQARRIVRDLGKELAEMAGTQTLIGRVKKDVRYAGPKAFNHFLKCTSSRDALLKKV